MGERNARYKTHETISKTSSALVDRRALAIFDNASKLVGLDWPKKELIEHLTKEDGLVPFQQRKVISIVGSGGLGKTTLANQVYQELEEGFQCHAFVSVSRNPDTMSVLQNILCQLGNEPHPNNIQAWSLQVLIMKINDALKDERYLIVIDDLWTKEAWETIDCALYKNDKGSKIITTTRMYDVAKECRSSDCDFVYEMKPLGRADSKKLFFERLFGSEDKCPAHLTRISSKILEKCDGLPLAIISISGLLAIISISGLLASKAPTEDEWGRVQNSIGHGLAKNSDVKSMMQILSLSYFDLPHYLKTCVLHLSVFPEDSTIDKKRLVRRWIAEGFIHKEQGKTLYELGERCFNELINRSLIQARDIDRYGEVRACQVHDTILDFIVSKSEEENFINLIGDGYQVIHGPDGKVRRLSLHASSKKKASTLTQLNLSHVRSVIVFDYIVELPLWSKFRFLRVLDLQGCRQVEGHHLTDIGNLFQLKYLSLRGTGVCELPEQIRKLQYLQTLDLKNSKVQILPASITHLRRLIYLAVDKGVRLPDGIGSMIALEDLECVDVLKQSFDFTRELGQLTNLRNVWMSFSSEDCSTAAAEGSHYKEYTSSIVSSLCKLDQLHSLLIDIDPNWTQDFSLDSLGSNALVALRRLEIMGHFISKFPNFVRSNFNLQFLNLHVNKIEVEDVRALGRLPALVSLVVVVDRSFIGGCLTPISGDDGFQSLQRFYYGCAVPVTFKAGAMPKVKKLALLYASETITQLGTYDVISHLGIQHLTSLDSVHFGLYLLNGKNIRENNESIAQDMTAEKMVHMSCQQLKATIRMKIRENEFIRHEVVAALFRAKRTMGKFSAEFLDRISFKLTWHLTTQWMMIISEDKKIFGKEDLYTDINIDDEHLMSRALERISKCPLKVIANVEVFQRTRLVLIVLHIKRYYNYIEIVSTPSISNCRAF